VHEFELRCGMRLVMELSIKYVLKKLPISFYRVNGLLSSKQAWHPSILEAQPSLELVEQDVLPPHPVCCHQPDA
jgi:hypothetical protein